MMLIGDPFPLGATFDGHGTNFALFSANAERVVLCLFDPETQEETQFILPERTDDIWHGYLEGAEPGTLYGYRVHGPFQPQQGHRFNPNKLLIDPYAKALSGKLRSSDLHLPYDRSCPQQDLTLDYRDNAAFMPKCVVTSRDKPWSGKRPEIPNNELIIYELHVKGFSQGICVDGQKAGFKALTSDSNIKHMKALGITSVELLPVHTFADDDFLLEKGLSNYWGYNSYQFFVPDARYVEQHAIDEFKAMVSTFHQHNIEVYLDVVFNHTAEGDQKGPMLSFKGIDNASYYRLQSDDKRYYQNTTGCGNSLNLNHPRVLQLVMDSLRYWVDQLGVDGFRFDLAPTLARESSDFVKDGTFFTTIKQDPVLSRVKLIAEPWDIGHHGYQLGQFPAQWFEWNDRYRDSVRRFWRGDEGQLPEFAKRLHGSSDLFESPGRHSYSSINFVTAHDGFTLNDLVSFEHRHNQINGEDNQDGHGHNFSHNYGVEGPTDDSNIQQIRNQQQRNLLATLLLSQGTPMLLAGDEFGNSQQGNNNSYCQDNPIGWINWPSKEQLPKTNVLFLKRLIQLRKTHPLLNRSGFQHGNTVSPETGLADISWWQPNGEMSDIHWHQARNKTLGMLVAETLQQDSTQVSCDHALLLLFNASINRTQFSLPPHQGQWQLLLDSSFPEDEGNACIEQFYPLSSRSCAVLALSPTKVNTPPKEVIHESH